MTAARITRLSPQQVTMLSTPGNSATKSFSWTLRRAP